VRVWLPALALCLITALLPACEGGECLEGSFGGVCDQQVQAGRDVVEEVAAEVGPDVVEETSPWPAAYQDPDASEKQVLAWQLVNEVRASVGLGPIDLLPTLNAAADAHADYYALHVSQYKSSGLSPHEENPAWSEGFTAVDFFDRMLAHDWSGQSGSEIIAFYHLPRKAIPGWMATLYHRIPIVDPATREMGYGGAGGTGTGNGIDVIDFGGTTASLGDRTVIYPYDGQVDVDRSWDGLESPQPPVPPTGYPSGPIVTATFAGALPTLTGHRLLDPSGAEIPHTWLTPATDEHLEIAGNVWSLYAHDPLEASTTYRVILEGTRRGEPYALEWSFTTALY